MSVAVTGAGAAFSAGVPVALFKINVGSGPGSPFDVTADGKEQAR